MRQNLVWTIIIGFFCTANCIYAQLPAPILECVNETPAGIEITWQSGQTSTNNCGSSFTSFRIYRVSADGQQCTFVAEITDPTATTFLDTNADASTTVYYKMEMVCGTNNTSPFSVTMDSDEPTPPEILNVRVVNDSTVLLIAEESTAPEAYGYVIYRDDLGGNFTPVAYVLASDVATNGLINFIDTLARPDIRSESYQIATFDKCSADNPIPGPVNGVIHKTIHLSVDNNDCEDELVLNWTRYVGWQNGVENYEVGIDSNNIFTLIETVSSTRQSFTYQLPEGQTAICLVIRANQNNSGTTSFSNKVCIDIAQTNAPSFLYMKQISVQPNGHVKLAWNIDVAGNVNELNLLRSPSDSASLTNLTKLPTSPPITSPMEAIDSTAITSDESYVYQIEHVDDCDFQIGSTVGETILLKQLNAFSITPKMRWNPFELTHATVLNYTIHRSKTGDNNFTPIQTLANTTVDFEDLSITEDDIANSLCYRIEAAYQIDLPDGTSEILTSFSNILCIEQAARLQMPNAFMPSGINNEFKPVIIRPNNDRYKMLIMNKWGELVFETTDPDVGWDGYYKGELAPQGVYAYYIQMITDRGLALERKGTVLLIR